MAVFRLSVIGDFIDRISGPINAAAAATRRAAAAMQRSMAAMNAASAGTARNFAAMGQAAQQAQRNVQAMSRWTNQGGGGGGRSRFTPVQQSLAAMGGMGYALGRGGPGILATLGPTYAGYKSLQEYARLEQRMSNVRKTLDLSRDQMADYMDEVRGISSRRGIPAQDIADMAWRVGQSGIVGRTAIMGVTDLVSETARVWDGMDPDTVSQTLSRIGNTWFRKDLLNNQEQFVTNLRRVADAINYLEETTPAQSSQVSKGVLRSLNAGALFGLSPEQVSATVATMQGYGEISGERAGTRLRILWQRLNSLGLTSSKKRQGALSDLGMTQQEWQGLMGEGAVNAQIELLRRLHGMDSEKAGKILGDLMGEEAAATTMTLVKNFPALLSNLASTSDEVAKLVLENEQLMATIEEFNPRLAAALRKAGGRVSDGSVAREYEIMADTMQAAFDRAWTSAKNLSSAIAEIASPQARQGLDWFEKLFQSGSSAIEEGNYNQRRRGARSGQNQPGPSIHFPWLGDGVNPFEDHKDPYRPLFRDVPGRPGDTNLYGRYRSGSIHYSDDISQRGGPLSNPSFESGPLSLWRQLNMLIDFAQQTAGKQVHDLVFPPAHGADAAGGAPAAGAVIDRLSAWSAQAAANITLPPPVINVPPPQSITLPAPQVHATGGTVHVTVTPGQISIRNPGAAGAPALQGDTSSGVSE